MRCGKRLSWSFVLVFMVLLIFGCASTKLTSVWHVEQKPAKPLKSVMVVGISNQISVRRSFEDLFVAELAKHNVRGLASYKVLKQGQEKDSKLVSKAAQNQNAEGVMAVHYKGVETKEDYVPPTTTPVVYRTWDGYYPMVYSYVSEPGYYRTRKYLSLETNLYRVSDGKLLWAGASRTLEQNSLKKLVQDLAKVVLNNMAQAGLVP